jgi:predicted lipoprotein with Yx(FWY)xxD motif
MFKMSKWVLVVCGLLLLALPALAQDATVSVSSSEEMGSFLVGPDGMTLYSFTRDPLNESVCVDRCLENWPALTVESADAVTAGEGVTGTLATIERADGTLQVTYNGFPLYYWARDEAAGDTTGHRVGNVWWIVPPATVYAQRVPELGSVLVGPNGMTLYMFTNDTDGESACYEQCAANWPPLTVESADAIVPGVNLVGELGTTERTDGTLQVTYNGMPLYYWAKDAAVGDTTGEGVGDVWYTVSPETAGIVESEELGSYLVAPWGMTLYTFTNDEAGVSNCTGDCAEAWPPYTVPADTRLVAPEGAEGEWALIDRGEGVMQVTYNGMPLYFWQDDAQPGDTTGQGVGDVWFVAAP